MKILIYELILLSICNQYLTMSVTRNKTAIRVPRNRTSVTRTRLNGSMPLRGNRRTSTKVPGLEETSPILHVNGSSKGDQDVETSDELTNAVTGLPVLSNCTVTQHMQNVPNTRLHQVVLRTPFILTYEQRDTLTRVVKKLWWNCR